MALWDRTRNLGALANIFRVWGGDIWWLQNRIENFGEWPDDEDHADMPDLVSSSDDHDEPHFPGDNDSIASSDDDGEDIIDLTPAERAARLRAWQNYARTLEPWDQWDPPIFGFGPIGPNRNRDDDDGHDQPPQP